MVISKSLTEKYFLVSVIVPCYNQAQYLSDALDSVLAQTYSDWECIIVNDGSPDNAKEVANRYLQKDTRFKYIERKNGGLSSARNAGLAIAKGDFIQFLDADDTILPDKFNSQLTTVIEQDADICICDYRKIDGATGNFLDKGYITPFMDGEYLSTIIHDWEFKLSIPCHCFIFKREIITKHNLVFNELLPNHEDWVFWVELLLTKPALINSKKVLCYYVIRANTMCGNDKLMKYGFLKAAKYLLNIIKKQEENQKLVELMQWKINEINNVYKRGKKSLFMHFAKRINKYVAKLKYEY